MFVPHKFSAPDFPKIYAAIACKLIAGRVRLLNAGGKIHTIGAFFILEHGEHTPNLTGSDQLDCTAEICKAVAAAIPKE